VLSVDFTLLIVETEIVIANGLLVRLLAQLEITPGRNAGYAVSEKAYVCVTLFWNLIDAWIFSVHHV